ncbi:hypothetical protein MRX96_008776 [Rhipicephalus microplus]
MKLAVAYRRWLAVVPAVHPAGASSPLPPEATVELDRRMVPSSPGAVTSRKPSSRGYRQASLCKATLSRFWFAAFLYGILRTRGPIAAHHAFRTPRGQFSFDYPVHHVTR